MDMSRFDYYKDYCITYLSREMRNIMQCSVLQDLGGKVEGDLLRGNVDSMLVEHSGEINRQSFNEWSPSIYLMYSSMDRNPS